MVVVVVVATTRAGARHRVPVEKDASATLLVQLSISSVLVAHTVVATLVIALTRLRAVRASSTASVAILALALHALLKDN